jgi:hypothetical protein
MPTMKKIACLASDHPICQNCMIEKLFLDSIGALIMSKFEKDATCMLCAPYSDAGGCRGIRPNLVRSRALGLDS